MTTITDLDQYVTGNSHTGRYTLVFPNGHEISVIPDTSHLLRWEVRARTSDRQPVEHSALVRGIARCLTTAMAEELLTELANLGDES